MKKPNRLYLFTMWLEFSSGFLRFLVLIPILTVLYMTPFVCFFLFSIFSNFGQMLQNPTFWIASFGAPFGFAVITAVPLAYANFGLSILNYFGYKGGGGLTRFGLGARDPSRRELKRINEMVGEILERLKDGDYRTDHLVLFTDMFVIDSPVDKIYTIGTTLYISSAMVMSDYLAPNLAHEIAHLNHEHSQVILALRNLLFPTSYLISADVQNYSTGRPMRVKSENNVEMPIDITFTEQEGASWSVSTAKLISLVYSLFGGGFGVWLMSPFWANYFRETDYIADDFVFNAGYKEEMVDYLELKKPYDTAVPYLLNWRPANELRIDTITELDEV